MSDPSRMINFRRAEYHLRNFNNVPGILVINNLDSIGDIQAFISRVFPVSSFSDIGPLLLIFNPTVTPGGHTFSIRPNFNILEFLRSIRSAPMVIIVPTWPPLNPVRALPMRSLGERLGPHAGYPRQARMGISTAGRAWDLQYQRRCTRGFWPSMNQLALPSGFQRGRTEWGGLMSNTTHASAAPFARTTRVAERSPQANAKPRKSGSEKDKKKQKRDDSASKPSLPSNLQHDGNEGAAIMSDTSRASATPLARNTGAIKRSPQEKDKNYRRGLTSNRNNQLRDTGAYVSTSPQTPPIPKPKSHGYKNRGNKAKESHAYDYMHVSNATGAVGGGLPPAAGIQNTRSDSEWNKQMQKRDDRASKLSVPIELQHHGIEEAAMVSDTFRASATPPARNTGAIKRSPQEKVKNYRSDLTYNRNNQLRDTGTYVSTSPRTPPIPNPKSRGYKNRGNKAKESHAYDDMHVANATGAVGGVLPPEAGIQNTRSGSAPLQVELEGDGAYGPALNQREEQSASHHLGAVKRETVSQKSAFVSPVARAPGAIRGERYSRIQNYGEAAARSQRKREEDGAYGPALNQGQKQTASHHLGARKKETVSPKSAFGAPFARAPGAEGGVRYAPQAQIQNKGEDKQEPPVKHQRPHIPQTNGNIPPGMQPILGTHSAPAPNVDTDSSDSNKKAVEGHQDPQLTHPSVQFLRRAAQREMILRKPPRKLQLRAWKLFHSASNFDLEKECESMRSQLNGKFFGWMAMYLVVEFACRDKQCHELLSRFLDVLNMPRFTRRVLIETHRNIKVMLSRMRDCYNIDNLTLLCNLGYWLGAITLAKGIPILYRDLNLKSLLLSAEVEGELALLIVVPFVTSVMESCVRSVEFMPPNKWTVSIVKILRKIRFRHSLLPLHMHIGMLFEHLNIEY